MTTLLLSVHTALGAEAFPEVPAIHEQPVPAPVLASPGLPGLFRLGENVIDLPASDPVTGTRAPAGPAAVAAIAEDPMPPGGVLGYVRNVEAESVEASAFVRPCAATLPDGRKVWTMAVRSPGAQALRLRLADVSLGEGELVVYAPAGAEFVARGPYRGKGPQGRGDFWTATLPGDVAFLEYVGEEAPRFAVREIGHIDALNLNGAPGAPNEDCHINARCQATLSDRVRNATGFMSFIEGGKVKTCTGTLLTDNDPETVVPYFISANHCISSQVVADTLEVVWLWQTSCGGLPPDFAKLPRSNGATLLETSSTKSGNDMAFLRLEGGIPKGVTLAGWSTAEPPKSADAPRFASHHPRGAWLRGGTFHRIDPVLLCKSLSDFYAFRCDTGVIEHGSSGSGIFNASGQLQGQLYGTCCPSWQNDEENCDQSGCDNRGSWNALYGRFDVSWGKVGKWLDGIGGTIHVDAAAAPGGNGTKSRPFRTVAAAQALSWPGSRILIQGGHYPEHLVLNRRVPILTQGGSVVVGN